MKKIIPYFIFLIPFIFIFFQDQFAQVLEGDEPRYLAYANNLMNGFYADPINPYLTNGPGYPLVIAFLLKLNFSLIAIKKLNLLYLFASISIFYNTSKLLIQNEKASLFFALLFEYYIITCNAEYFKLLTEPLTILLICSITYLILLNANKYKLSIGVLIGFLILLKVIFAYVVISLIAIFVIKKLMDYKIKTTVVFIKILLLALLTNTPYLAYTYSLTGKVLCWSDHGGKSIYWMATPNKYELGDFIPSSLKLPNSKPIVNFDSNYIVSNHSADIKQINAMPINEQDNAYKEKAFHLIFKHPTKFIANWFCSVSRLLFNRPFTFSIQHNRGNPFFFIEIPSALFLALFLIYNVNLIKNKGQSAIVFLYLFGLLHLIGSSLSYTSFRQFYIITPIFFILFTPIIFKMISLINSNYFELKTIDYEK